MSAMTTATITEYGYEMQQKGDLFRYSCSACGKTGRWYRDGNMANYSLRRHQGDSMERTPCPKIR